jgi:hypothetical protein
MDYISGLKIIVKLDLNGVVYRYDPVINTPAKYSISEARTQQGAGFALLSKDDLLV